MVQKINTSKKLKLPYVIAIVAVAIISAVFVYHITRPKEPIPTLNQYTKGESGQPISTSNSSGDSSEPSANSPSSSKTGGSGTTLVAPSGNFISNHRPNLSGSPAPNSMTSVCNTSPGATCIISFTKSGSTKSLPAQVTDDGGSAYWSWKLQDIGITTGSWTVSATSNLGGNSLSSTDPRTLDVSQ